MQSDVTPTALVVGGGPAGLVAAERLAAAGVSVTVAEHMASPGRKLLLAGRGGLNLTHSEPLSTFLGRYGDADRRLVAAVEEFDPDALRAWAEGMGEPTFVGTSGRVFPESLRANDLLRAWLERLGALGVVIRTGIRWCGWSGAGHELRIVRTGGSETVHPDVAVLALGGASWPKVGSDGEWVDTLRSAGVAVADLRASNCGIDVAWSEVFAGRFAGEPVKNVSLTVGDLSVRGELMVTEHGLEGGAVYALSRALRDALDRAGSVVVRVDLRPDLELDAIAERLARRRAKESVSTSLRRSVGLPPVAVGLLREAAANRLPGDPSALAALVRSVPLRVDGLAPLERAISTSGGVRFDQLDEHLMLRARPGTFVAGEMLDWDAPTGGYLLQASFATGVAAAEGALAWLRSSALRSARDGPSPSCP